MPLLPLSIAGLGVGLLVVAFVVLSGGPAPTPTPGPSGEIGLATPWVDLPATENADGSLGSANARLVIQEWADYQCPACRAYAETIEPNLVDGYVRPGTIRLVFHDFAFIGPESVAAATAARCAGEQGRYWAYHAYLYPNQGAENGGTFGDTFLRAVAATIGLDLTAFDSCRTAGDAQQAVITSTAQGRQLGIKSTPTLVIGDQAPIEGVPNWQQFQSFLDSLLGS